MCTDSLNDGWNPLISSIALIMLDFHWFPICCVVIFHDCPLDSRTNDFHVATQMYQILGTSSAFEIRVRLNGNLWTYFEDFTLRFRPFSIALSRHSNRNRSPGIIELLGNEMYSGELGPSTIVGAVSQSFVSKMESHGISIGPRF